MKSTLILGLGKSGRAAAELLLSHKKNVCAFDDYLDSKEVTYLEKLGLKRIFDLRAVCWKEIDQCVISPGVDPKHIIYTTAKDRGISIVTEMELALPFLSEPLIAVTGTNGKTTVTLLIEHVFNTSGICAKAVGNVGMPLCSYVLTSKKAEVLVVELSSFQLETLSSSVFDHAIILNITPDHLDRYPDVEIYARTKLRLQNCIKERGFLFVHEKVIERFGFLLEKKEYQTLGFYQKDLECFSSILYREYPEHERENTLAAWALCKPFGISHAQFTKALTTFCRPPHRLEYIASIAGVDYYDDSKGTNIDAVICAVRAMKKEVILIAGGVDKGSSYALWKKPFSGKVRQIIAIGLAAKKIQQELHPFVPVICVDSMQSAVIMAKKLAKEKESVLLSPGCASFDMFCDYAHRGKEFQYQVRLLRDGEI
ncbi:UDP-N-acetylmuramoyl-L-alanine--D-glutamate ligase [Candidatus Rhabdochlamydia porcellionis]|jgi:UDP-N-acetylmuramoylalanine--D-glutamate ligase|uniref:UDP-N-acetylmuramoylalanine--D-glutamate ligase n=1 Tax=Candidatus Rhabdochlamydia porcellionis TaxID=225148 RepID=A0ABX8YYT6_9BACT|nr:UDP-N-acetylmuramoyl-L-alanine--D-glutamate ligase [Candidatus Rhabdochlamydia porcellionis]QZA58499.1 UDP-N-acetylmuramoylalanine--D-glutamate ligase [Candidatus Rhabdochlamydia porcellionis]